MQIVAFCKQKQAFIVSDACTFLYLSFLFLRLNCFLRHNKQELPFIKEAPLSHAKTA